MRICIIRTETWLDDNFELIDKILTNAINDFILDSDEIINIEKHTENNGLSRFWIYYKDNAKKRRFYVPGGAIPSPYEGLSSSPSPSY